MSSGQHLRLAQCILSQCERAFGFLVKTRSRYCLPVSPTFTRKHSQQFNLRNYCNSTVRMEVARSFRVGLEKG